MKRFVAGADRGRSTSLPQGGNMAERLIVGRSQTKLRRPDSRHQFSDPESGLGIRLIWEMSGS